VDAVGTVTMPVHIQIAWFGVDLDYQGLPRPASLLPLVFAQEAGETVDADQLEGEIRAAVKDTVKKRSRELRRLY
jgi:hypothetical protein